MSRYYEIDGKQLPSVTTILGKMMAKEMLVPWAAKVTAASFKEQVLNNREPLTNELLDEMEGKAKKAHREQSTEAMNKGTIVHEAIEAWIKSDGTLQPYELKDPVAKHGLEQFLLWGGEHDVDIINYEQQVSDKQTFAGRYDLLARIDGKLTLLDFKTSKAIYDEYKLQCHAYASCIVGEVGVEQVAVLRLDKETAEFEYVAWGYNSDLAVAFSAMAVAYNILFPYKEKKKKKS